VEDLYVKKSPLEHVLLRPGMYIGSTGMTSSADAHSDPVWVWNAAAQRMERTALAYCPGLLKIFDEILVNACDNRVRDPAGTTRLEVRIDTGARTGGDTRKGARAPTISVLNNGRGIPVAFHSKEGMHVPELVLGHLMTGSNFGAEDATATATATAARATPAAAGGSDAKGAAGDSLSATTGGRHGYGAKLTNIFSSEFTVETADSGSGKGYRQQWRNNMRERSEPALVDIALKQKTASRTSTPAAARVAPTAPTVAAGGGEDVAATAARLGGDFTRITFTPDLSRFALPPTADGALCIDEGTAAMMVRRVIDAAGTLGGNGKVTVVLNGVPIPIRSFVDYAETYTPGPSELVGEAASSAPVATDSEPDSDGPLPSAAAALRTLVPLQLSPRWELAVGVAGLDLAAYQEGAAPHLAPYNEPLVVSFVNSMHTPRGGSHAQLCLDALCRKLVPLIQKKAPSADIAVTPASVRAHLRLFVNARIENPSFDSQSKEMLVTAPDALFAGTPAAATAVPDPVAALGIPDKFIRQLLEQTGLADVVLASLASRASAKLAKVLKKTAKNPESKIKAIPKLEDANWAGTRKAAECTLILTEGDSAKALAVSGLAVVGRDRFGVFPLRGKLLNVRGLSPTAALANTEVAALVAILGLDFTKDYTGLSAEQRGLRYGKVMIMADQDVDGSHIKGLVLNLFHSFWPGLLACSADGNEPGATANHFLEQFQTPLLKARKGTVTREFFSAAQFDAWRHEDPVHRQAGAKVPSIVAAAVREAEKMGRLYGEAHEGKWTFKYYKGLGTSTSTEGRAYFSNLQRYRKPFTWASAGDGFKLQMAFAKDKVEERKSWLLANPSTDEPETIASSIKTVTSMPLIVVPAVEDSKATNKTEGKRKKASTGSPASNEPALLSSAAPDAIPSMSFSSFIDHELIEFSRADLLRSIPSVLDGLKPSQRKVLFASFKRAGGAGAGHVRSATRQQDASGERQEYMANEELEGDAVKPEKKAGTASLVSENGAHTLSGPTGSEIKVMQLAGYVAETTLYHHGEASLTATIVNMAQDYVGSNNVPLFAPLGQFGTRAQGGKDTASPRYIFTRLSPFSRFIFPLADDPLLRLRDDDGQMVEPVAYIPTVPLVLLNGAQGIGTGWSTYVPQHNPLHVIDALEKKVRATYGCSSFPEAASVALVPWWRKYQGSITPQPSGTGFITSGKAAWETDAETESHSANRKNALRTEPQDTKSTAEAGPRGSLNVRISELPIGKWTEDYKAYLLGLVSKGYLKHIREYHTEDSVDFVVRINHEGLAELRGKHNDDLDSFFMLSSSISTRNMHLFNPQGVIERYSGPDQIINAFLPYRYSLYALRKTRQINLLEEAILRSSTKVRFLEEVVSGKLVIGKKRKDALVAELAQRGFPAFSTAASQSKKLPAAPLQERLPEDAFIAFKRVRAFVDENSILPFDVRLTTPTTGLGNSSDYDYLLSLPLLQLTEEHMAKAAAAKQTAEADLTSVKSNSVEDLWLAELQVLRESLRHHLNL
jgi:DNA topoisomerase-2